MIVADLCLITRLVYIVVFILLVCFSTVGLFALAST